MALVKVDRKSPLAESNPPLIYVMIIKNFILVKSDVLSPLSQCQSYYQCASFSLSFLWIDRSTREGRRAPENAVGLKKTGSFFFCLSLQRDTDILMCVSDASLDGHYYANSRQTPQRTRTVSKVNRVMFMGFLIRYFTLINYSLHIRIFYLTRSICTDDFSTCNL